MRHILNLIGIDDNHDIGIVLLELNLQTVTEEQNKK